MASKHASIDAEYHILRLGVISSNTIASRTSLALKHLIGEQEHAKRPLVCLRSRASTANKLISAIEIAKRDLIQNGRKVYQYSSLATETFTPPRSSDTSHKLVEGGIEGGIDEDVAFEIMGQQEDSKPIPTLTVFLSLVPVKELREAYGYAAHRSYQCWLANLFDSEQVS